MGLIGFGLGLIGLGLGLLGMKRRIVAGPAVSDMYGISFTELDKGWDYWDLD